MHGVRLSLLTVLFAVATLGVAHGQSAGVTLEPLAVHRALGGGVRDATLGPNGQRAVTRGQLGDFVLWSCGPQWQVIARLDAAGPRRSVLLRERETTPPTTGHVLAVHPSEPWIVRQRRDETELVDLSSATSTELPRLTHAAFDQTGNLLAGARHERVMVLARRDGRFETVFEVERTKSVHHLFFRDLDGRLVASDHQSHTLLGSSEHGWSLLETRQGPAVGYRGDEPVYVWRLHGAVSTNGQVLRMDASGRLTDPDEPARTVWSAGGRITQLRLSDRGDAVVVDLSGRATVVLAEGGAQELAAHAGNAVELTFSRDGNCVGARTPTGGSILNAENSQVAWQRNGTTTFVRGPQGPEFWVVDEHEIQRIHPGLSAPIDRLPIPEHLQVSLDPNPALRDLSSTGPWTTHPAAASIDGSHFFFRCSTGGHRPTEDAALLTRDGSARRIPIPQTNSVMLENGAIVWSDEAQRLAVSQLPFPLSCGTFLTGDEAWGALWLFDLEGDLVGHRVSDAGVTALAFDPTGSRIAFAEGGRLVVGDGRHLGVIDERVVLENRNILWLGFVDDDLLLTHDGASLRAYTLPGLEPTAVANPELIGSLRPLTASALSTDGRTLALGGNGRVATFRVRRQD